MTLLRVIFTTAGAAIVCSLSGCGGEKISQTCDEPQPYQAVVPSKKIVVPDGLDPLEEFKEMPIPKAEVPPRPPGSRCIEAAPSILTGGSVGK